MTRKDNMLRILILLGIILCFSFSIKFFLIALDLKPIDDSYCQIYKDQELTTTRMCINGDCEKEYALNSTWISESTLNRSCEVIKE